MLVHNFLQQSAKKAGNKIALIHGRERVSYAALAAHSQHIAYWLVEKGLTHGERVALLTDNPAHYISSYFAIQQAGGIVVGINTQTSERSLNTLLLDCQPTFVLISGQPRKYSRFIESHQTATQLKDIEALCSLTEMMPISFQPPPRKKGDVAQIIYTSGTTGKPKGVMLSHLNLVANTKSIIEYLGLTDQDTAMAVLPFFYSYGNSVMLTHIASGGTLIVNQSFVFPNLILEQMLEEKVTGLSGVPSTFAILLHRSALRDFTFPHLRYLTQAGAAMSPKMATQLHELFPHCAIYIMYGQTEASPRLSYLGPEDLPNKPGSIGKAIPGVTLEILREDATPAEPGETGEIVACGDNIMVGYWQRPDETAQALRNGKLWTGDLAYTDKDGFLYIVSRKTDMIKCGSHRIAPKEIEEILLELDCVLEATVVGKNDVILGETIHAYVVLQQHSAMTPKQIITFCRKHLPAFKVPHVITILDELPKTESGKIRKEDLK